MRPAGRTLTAAAVFLSFVAVAIVQTWPLAQHLHDRFTAPVSGDTGVYIWNTWVFGYELVEHHRSPFATETLPGFGGPVDVSLHNYTVFNDLLAIVLTPLAGLPTAFNLIFLLNFALAGVGMYALVRGLPLTAHVDRGTAWLAGLLFACSPYLVARGNGHFSIAAAAPLPFFVLLFQRTLDHKRLRDAAGAGACVAWAAYSDLYFPVYCVLLALALVLAQAIDVRFPRRGANAPRPRALPVFDGLLVLLLTVVLIVRFFGDGAVELGSLVISMRTMYTPVLVLTVLVLLRALVARPPRITWHGVPIVSLLAPAAVMVLSTLLLLSPLLAAIALRAADGEMVHAPVPWRSSAPGIDLVALLLPNPNHPLAPDSIVRWLRSQPGEGAASLPLVAIAVIAVAWWRGRRPDRAWFALTIAFALLALGPFVRVAGFETLIPTPWTFLRYVPIIGEARMPGRLALLVILGVCVLFAAALRTAAPRRALVLIVAFALGFELLAAPRQLYSAEMPRFVERIASDPRDGRVLHVPFGIRDGLATHGAFTPAALYFQTAHHKGLIGGYLSRLSERRRTLFLEHDFMGPLIRMSEGETLSTAEIEAARAAAAAFVDDGDVRWIIVEDAVTPPELRAFVESALRPTHVGSEAGWSLYELPRSAGAASAE